MVRPGLLIDQMFTINFYKLILRLDSLLIDVLMGKKPVEFIVLNSQNQKLKHIFLI